MDEQTDEIRRGAGDPRDGEPRPEPPPAGKRGRRRKAAPSDAVAPPTGEEAAPTADPDANPEAFTDVDHLRKKGLRVVPVVTGAVVDSAGSFLFYVDGHDDARSSVQAQLNQILGGGPSREEHLARARARASFLSRKLSEPR